jgi:hypothetical protein
MKKSLNLLILFLIILTPSLLLAANNWDFIKDEEFCYIQSYPSETIIPEGKKRGKHSLIVYRIHKSSDLIIQVTAGFDYKSSDSISVTIDDSDYNFYTDLDTAWAEEDDKTIKAMKKGLDFITTGFSSKGTKVVDIYSLKGFTLAINNLINNC